MKSMQNVKIKKEALEQLKIDVKLGFDNKEEIFDNISYVFYEEDGFDDSFSEDELGDIISEYYNKHQQESLKWVFPTDFDRLAKSFDELIDQKIICLHNVYNSEDGEADCLHVSDRLSKAKIETIGFCYYGSFDLELVVKENEESLFLEFGSLKPGKEELLRVRDLIVKTLLSNGLEVNILDLSTKMIEIKNINWQKKPDREDWWIDRIFHKLCNTFISIN